MTKNKKNKKPASKLSKKNIKKKSLSKTTWLLIILILALVFTVAGVCGYNYRQSHNGSLSSFNATPYNVVKPLVKPYASSQSLMSPTSVRSIYNLAGKGTGSGTIAIVDAYDDPSIANDLNTFDTRYNLAACTTTNGCFTKYKTTSSIATNSGWAIEEALDVEWAHTIAPTAKILLVEARSANGPDLMTAINYARSQSNVVSISMSWGGDEFSSETAYESSFTSSYGASFFAASGDNGHGTSWPAVSANVIGVGGTSVTLNNLGNLSSETAWNGSGGGLSSYISEPQRQKTANIPSANGHRATPDVAYNADPSSGYPVYDSVPYNNYAGWFQVGGTSAGSPQWAAIASLSSKTLTLDHLYSDASRAGQTSIRDILTGTNGSCGYYCSARSGYDYVTGYGSPLVATY